MDLPVSALTGRARRELVTARLSHRDPGRRERRPGRAAGMIPEGLQAGTRQPAGRDGRFCHPRGRMRRGHVRGTLALALQVQHVEMVEMGEMPGMGLVRDGRRDRKRSQDRGGHRRAGREQVSEQQQSDQHDDPRVEGQGTYQGKRAEPNTFPVPGEGMLTGAAGSVIVTADTPIDCGQWPDGKPWNIATLTSRET